ncbi:hypothetical protein HZH66_007316 [Vespula vulgaris]|uniref:Uncharacterized protein n=1 Tax=Vespula vulgaris TaxID=7454 RepID=A0A834N667_VESVU|nr:hypothetical protein HZH66_007316 [Vespula vulgaris]
MQGFPLAETFEGISRQSKFLSMKYHGDGLFDRLRDCGQTSTVSIYELPKIIFDWKQFLIVAKNAIDVATPSNDVTKEIAIAIEEL